MYNAATFVCIIFSCVHVLLVHQNDRIICKITSCKITSCKIANWASALSAYWLYAFDCILSYWPYMHIVKMTGKTSKLERVKHWGRNYLVIPTYMTKYSTNTVWRLRLGDVKSGWACALYTLKMRLSKRNLTNINNFTSHNSLGPV
jgi:hypothetical protein